MAKHDDLQRYFDGELDDAERKRVEESLTDEDRLRLESLGDVRALVVGALRAETDEAPVDVWRAIEGDVVKKPAQRRWRDRVRARRLAGTGAGLLVAAAATLLLLFRPWSPAMPTNNCDLESLELDGVQATVLKVPDAHHGGENNTTILFTMEDD